MRNLRTYMLGIVFTGAVNTVALADGTDLSSDSSRASTVKSPRVYTAMRVYGQRPLIDGLLNDDCWQRGNWAGDFVQWIPREGAQPSQPTELNIQYDDRNIYVAIRAHDREPDKIVRKGGRRDELNGDMVGITFDSYHDHRTGFEFDLSAVGQKVDLLLTNPMNPDYNWNAVWDGKTAEEDSAWTAEFEIPLSQLRYSGDDEQVWGMHVWRWIDRLQEESDWEPQSSEGPGILYLFGELRGIRGLPPSRRIEIMPYAVGKLKTFPVEPGDPFAENGKRWMGSPGLDAKIGLSSNFTADLTLNPDFGQVEADPSVMNLTAYETFFEEKRPFFLEGRNIFAFDFDNVNLFYSRRIGHTPLYVPALQTGESMKYPDNTTILGALKVSGKTSDGLALGVVQSITGREVATIHGAGTASDVAVEPLTNYSLARVQKDFDAGNTVIGGIVTSTNRRIRDQQLDFMSRDAFTGGLDLLHQWNDKEFFVTAKIVGSTIGGGTEAMTALQSASARYFQRPDAPYLNFDSSRTHLSGYGGQIRVGKGSKGLWRYSAEFDWRSPGLDLNDLGFMQTADVIKARTSLSYFVNQPVGILRTYTVGINHTSNADFGGRYLSTDLGGSLYLEFLNNWALSVGLTYEPEGLDPWLLRGGYTMRVPSSWSLTTHARTDPSRQIFLECTANFSASAHHSRGSSYVEPAVSLMPTTALKISLGMNYSISNDDLQYVTAVSTDNVRRDILAHIRQRSLGITFRVDYNLTPELSLQYYGSPFASVGRYTSFKEVAAPRADNYTDRFLQLEPLLAGSDYQVYRDATLPPTYTFGNPDFAFGQFRSILVLRWEYLPGSQLFLVWSHERTTFNQPGDGSVGGAIRNLGSIAPTNIFLAKVSYWVSL